MIKIKNFVKKMDISAVQYSNICDSNIVYSCTLFVRYCTSSYCLLQDLPRRRSWSTESCCRRLTTSGAHSLLRAGRAAAGAARRTRTSSREPSSTILSCSPASSSLPLSSRASACPTRAILVCIYKYHIHRTK